MINAMINTLTGTMELEKEKETSAWETGFSRRDFVKPYTYYVNGNWDY